MYPCLFNVYMDEVMKEVKMRMGREWRLPGLLYVDDYFLWRVGGGTKGNGGMIC